MKHLVKYLCLVFVLGLGFAAYALTSPPVNLPITITPSSPPPSGCTSPSCFMLGEYNPSPTIPLSGGFCVALGRCPDTTLNSSYLLPGGFGSDPSSNGGYPTAVTDAFAGGGCDHATLGSNFTYAAMGQPGGPCDALWTTEDNQIINYARTGHVRVIRWNDEWVGGYHSLDSSPFCTPNPSDTSNGCPLDAPTTLSNPSLWTNFWRRRIQLARTNFANAGVPVPPMIFGMPSQTSEVPFWNYDDLVELGSVDFYINNDPSSTSAQQWAFFCGQQTVPCTPDSPMGFLAAFAAQHNKPLYIGEWGVCDEHGDGYLMTKSIQWIFASNVVGANYWDTDYTINTAANDCKLGTYPAKLAAFQAGFNVPFSATNSFWNNGWANWGNNPLNGGGQLPGCSSGVDVLSSCGSGNFYY